MLIPCWPFFNITKVDFLSIFIFFMHFHGHKSICIKILNYRDNCKIFIREPRLNQNNSLLVVEIFDRNHVLALLISNVFSPQTNSNPFSYVISDTNYTDYLANYHHSHQLNTTSLHITSFIISIP